MLGYTCSISEDTQEQDQQIIKRCTKLVPKTILQMCHKCSTTHHFIQLYLLIEILCDVLALYHILDYLSIY